MTRTPEALQQDNERLQRELAQARAALEDFTYSVSHDLRASLRHVNAYVQIIQEDLSEQGNPALLGYLGTVTQAAQQMARQIDGLTELSRLTRLDLHCTPVAVEPLLREVCAELALTLSGRVVDWQLAPDFPALQCDATLLRQLLLHLLSNALKFSAARPVAEIQVTWQMADNGQCAITVADNGAGFNPQYKDKLFHVFQRLHGAREFDGLGMGLALTRKIVERHGGAVWANATPDAGARISFTLPLVAAAGAPQTCSV